MIIQFASGRSLRDLCVYGILAHERPGVWTNLQQRLAERQIVAPSAARA